MTNDQKTTKYLQQDTYGSIPHLPGSRRGPGDHGLQPNQCLLLTGGKKDRRYTVTVSEKLDGSSVCCYRDGDTLVPLTRAGYRAEESPFPQHHLFALWVYANADRFGALQPGERLCGEWLAQAHGTRYDLTGRTPFAPFDLMRLPHRRATYDELVARFCDAFTYPRLLWCGGPCSIEDAMTILGDYGHHGALDHAEGAVWRLECAGEFRLLAKYVRPGKLDGKYFPKIDEETGVVSGEEIWNWRPDNICIDKAR
jgi:hypothetical protein